MFEALKKYAEFRGRSTRKEYWLFVLFYFLVVFWIVILTWIVGLSMGIPRYNIENLSTVLSFIFELIILIPSIAVDFRRLHDFDASGWWAIVIFAFWIIGLVSYLLGSVLFAAFLWIITIIAWIAIGLVHGTEGPNRYGDDPKMG
ncbi:MAG: DUF805 domain-containing protein [Pseudomonadota bacterium]